MIRLLLGLWKYHGYGTRQCKITGTVYTMDYKGDYFKCSEETQRNFNKIK